MSVRVNKATLTQATERLLQDQKGFTASAFVKGIRKMHLN